MRLILVATLSIITALAACSRQQSAGKQTAGARTTVKTDSIRVDSSAAPPTVDLVTGQFSFEADTHFVAVDAQYANKELYLQKPVWQAFKTMADSAADDGITLTLISGTRNFPYQKSIWDRKWGASTAATDSAKAAEILQFSSMPMTSRHHWGTDLDINDLNNAYFESGQGAKEYAWLRENANRFGFYQPYTPKNNGRTGYNEEKWHWSYMPLAAPYLRYYNRQVSNADISGFEGAQLAPAIDMVGNYVNGLSKKVKQY